MVSTSTGPIPPHPGYDKSGAKPQVFVDVPVPRVRPEAQGIYRQAQGSVGMVLQLEGQRVPQGFSRTKAPPKDHMNENVRRMRMIQRQTRRKEAEKEQHQPKPVKALWKSTKYEGVASRVKEELSKAPPAPRPHSANYLRAHSRTGQVPLSARPASAEPSELDLSVPKAETAREVRLIRRELDFIKLNGKGARKAQMHKSPSMSALDDLKKWKEDQDQKYKKGEVPKYLQKRKQEWEREEQERVANIPDPEMPEGHRVMPDAERRETLEKLKTTERDLQQQLAVLPIRSDTVHLRKKKQDLDAKIRDVEEAIRIFSRRKVYVKQE